MAKLSKEELEELQSAESWEGTDQTVQTVQPSSKFARAIVSVAFSREDFETVAEYARQHGMKTSEFIRLAALDKTTP